MPLHTVESFNKTVMCNFTLLTRMLVAIRVPSIMSMHPTQYCTRQHNRCRSIDCFVMHRLVGGSASTEGNRGGLRITDRRKGKEPNYDEGDASPSIGRTHVSRWVVLGNAEIQEILV